MRRALLLAGLSVLVGAIWLKWPALQHWLAVHTGTVNEAGPYYGFWSGFGSDIGELAIVGSLAGLLRKHNCEVKGCWRIGRHATAGGHHVCRKHHPDDHLTSEHVHRAHRQALGGCDRM